MTERPLAALTDDEKIVLTVLSDVRCCARAFAGVGPDDALDVKQIQRLTVARATKRR